MKWFDRFELIPFSGIRNETTEELHFGLSSKQLRRIMGRPDGADVEDYRIGLCDYYGDKRDGHFRVGYGVNGANSFNFHSRGKIWVQGIRLLKQRKEDVLQQLERLGHRWRYPPKHNVCRDSYSYFPTLGMYLWSSGKYISEVRVFDRKWWNDNMARKRATY